MNVNVFIYTHMQTHIYTHIYIYIYTYIHILNHKVLRVSFVSCHVYLFRICLMLFYAGCAFTRYRPCLAICLHISYYICLS